jgi:hypothetical protein
MRMRMNEECSMFIGFQMDVVQAQELSFLLLQLQGLELEK